MFKELNILQHFFENPTKEFGVREIARLIRITPATASTKLQQLKKEHILASRKERQLVLYKADLESDSYRDLKTFTTIRLLKTIGVIDHINKFYLKPTIVLFGSASKGLDTHTSDIDIVVVSEKKDVLSDLKIYEKKLKRKIELFPVRTLKDLKNEHLINN